MINRNLLATAVSLALIAAACGGTAETAATTDTSSVTPTTVASSAATSTTDDTEVEADAGPLYLGVSIHVEGWSDEDRNGAKFDRHVDGLLMVAEAAADGGAIFTFELSEVFIDAVVQWDSDIIDRLHALGHGTGIHADVGGRADPSLEALVAPLVRMRDKAAAVGVDTRHVSGICSQGPWVEAALEAGFESTNGAVEYCAMSLGSTAVPDGWDLSACTSPAACHGQLQVDADTRIHPYTVDSSADFLSASESGLVLMIGNSGISIVCAAESETGGGCVGDADDLPFAEAVLEEFLEGRDPSRVAALTMSWSVGSVPDAGFVVAFVDVFEDAVAQGRAVWAANGDIGQAVLDHQADGGTDEAGGEALPVIVSIHSHFVDDYLPYTNASLQVLDEGEFARLQSLISATAEVLADYSIVANWQLSYGVARALCTADETGIVEGLIGLGHEIGIHLHPLDDLDRAIAEISACGVEAKAVSGLAFTTGRAGRGEVIGAAQTWLHAVEDADFETVLVGIGDGSNPLDAECRDYGGVAFQASAGALLHSWVVSPDDPCTADPTGTLSIVTHAGLPFGGRRGDGPSDADGNLVGPEHADVWSKWLESALASASDAATWGVVVPFPAMVGRDGASDPFLDAFDVILGEIAAAVAAGDAVSVTASEAAKLVGALSP